MSKTIPLTPGTLLMESEACLPAREAGEKIANMLLVFVAAKFNGQPAWCGVTEPIDYSNEPNFDAALRYATLKLAPLGWEVYQCGMYPEATRFAVEVSREYKWVDASPAPSLTLLNAHRG